MTSIKAIFFLNAQLKSPSGSTDYVVSLTKWDNLWQWGGIEEHDLPKYLFSRNKPAAIDGVEWRLVRDIRKEMGDDVYDKKVRHFFTLVVDDPLIRYNDINVTWKKFEGIFMVFTPLVTYTEAWKDYYRQSLQEIYDDNVMYMEFRGVLPEVCYTSPDNMNRALTKLICNRFKIEGQFGRHS